MAVTGGLVPSGLKQFQNCAVTGGDLCKKPEKSKKSTRMIVSVLKEDLTVVYVLFCSSTKWNYP